jgi:transposase
LCSDTVTESQRRAEFLTDVRTRIADHPAKHVAELLPWNWQPANSVRAAA